jgi:copper homeostasis protein CutC
MATVFDNASADEKVTLYSALANYVDAVSRQEVKWRKAEVKRLSTYHEMTLAYAEVNLKQWSSLIDTSVQQVGDSAAGGIKSESITNLLNTIGIFYIGHGVNK